MPVDEQAFAGQSHEEEDNDNKGTQNSVPFYKLFVFSDFWDTILMFVGTIGAIAHGINPALMALLFGDLADAFGGNQTESVLPVVSRVCPPSFIHSSSSSNQLIDFPSPSIAGVT